MSESPAAVPIDASLIGRDLAPVRWSWGPDAAILHALGVGAAPPRDLALLYEGAGPAVLPTFATVATALGFRPLLEELGLERLAVLHGEQAISLAAPLLPRGALTVRRQVVEVHDKGGGALVVVEERDDGERPAFRARSSWWIAGAGGFERSLPRRGKRAPAIPAGAADLVRRVPVRPELAAIHRLSGDRNPIHIDPADARAAGFERPFLHGLCTFGIVGLELVHGLCSGEPERLRELQGRFLSVVYPGEELTVEAWVEALGSARLAARVGDRLVFGHGRAGYLH